MKKLDIIIPHFNEPWETGKKFFDMLSMQRGVDFHDIGVTIVHDGTEAFPEEYFVLPFSVTQKSIPHAGVSAARNAGLDESDAPWIMFCDFDDMFASIYSLRHILSVLPTDDYDELWCEFYAEDRKKDGRTIIHVRGENSVFVHGKLFRRDFLMKNQLRFPEDMEFNEDSAFVATIHALTDYRRIGKITAETPLYIWTFREGSATGTQSNRARALRGMYMRNKVVCDAFHRNLPEERYQTMVCRTAYDAYHILNAVELPDILVPLVDDFKAWWSIHKKAFKKCPAQLRRESAEASWKEHCLGDKEEIERWGTLDKPVFNDKISFGSWISEVTKP